MSEDLLELLDELSIEQAILLGHSMGGKVAMHFSLHYPERVKGLIVEDISPLAYLQNHENVIYHQNIINALKSLPINHFTSRKEAEIALSKAINDVSLNKFLLKNLQRNKDGKLVWRIDLGVLVKNLYRIMENITDEVKPSDIYSLFIRGSLSKYISNEDEVAIKTFFPRSTIKTIQNAGHWTHNEQQSDFLQTVKQYLSLLNSADYQISHSQ
jgi:pimeloyl-ACP methyl ester carboxylesterase